MAALLSTHLFVGVFNSKILSLPLKTITSNARELSLGNFDTGLPFSLTARQDEIGQLGIAFERMAASVRGAVHDISKLSTDTRAGNLAARAEPEIYHGDFRRIVAGMNASLDGICSNLDSMPGALLLLNERLEHMYHNQAMKEIMERHGLRVGDNILLSFLPHTDANALPPAVARLFSPGPQQETFYESDASLADAQGDVYDYAVSLGRVRGRTRRSASCSSSMTSRFLPGPKPRRRPPATRKAISCPA